MATNFILTGRQLLPASGMEYWHNLDANTGANGSVVSSMPDYSGHNRHLTAASNQPILDVTALPANFLETRKAVYFDGAANNPLVNSAATVTLKHLFILAKYDGAAFASQEGLLSASTTTNILAGNSATLVNFYNLGLGYTFYKNSASYPESAMPAPMNAWGLMEIQAPAGISMAGIKIGQQNGGGAAKWKGWVAENLAYSRVLTETERKRVIMYFNLKYGMQRYGANELYFPSDNLLDFRRSRFYAEPPKYDKITDSYEFEDGGKTFNETADNAPRRWEYEYLGRSPEQVAIFDEFFNQARYANKFYFTDKYGTTHSGVQIESYNRSHEAHKSWRNDAKFVLVKYP